MTKLKITRWNRLVMYLSKFEIGKIVSRKEILREIYTRKIPAGLTSVDSYLILLKGSEFLHPVSPGKYIVVNRILLDMSYTNIKELYSKIIHTEIDPLTKLFKNWTIAELIEKNKEI